MNAFDRKIAFIATVAALVIGLLPLGAWAQASSPHFILKKSTLSAAGAKGLANAGGTLRMGASAAQDSAAGGASSAHFALRAGFWGPTQSAAIPGDCDSNGTVSIGEVQKAINMFLGTFAPGCGVDCNGDGTVSIGEVQKVINAFLGLASSC